MFHIRGPILRILELFQSIVIVAHHDILKLMTLVLRVSKLLIMAKDIEGLRSIVVSEVFLQLISHAIVLQCVGVVSRTSIPLINSKY
jgi:hypothetical protein